MKADERIWDIVFVEPGRMIHDGVAVRVEATTPADRRKGFVPAYHCGIYAIGTGVRVGRISLRVGDTSHIRLYAGHIGYAVVAPQRGNRYAGKACLAMAPLILQHYESVIITCDPDNTPSARTIERIGGVFIECVEVPRSDPIRSRLGSTHKNRYLWQIPESAPSQSPPP